MFRKASSLQSFCTVLKHKKNPPSQVIFQQWEIWWIIKWEWNSSVNSQWIMKEIKLIGQIFTGNCYLEDQINNYWSHKAGAVTQYCDWHQTRFLPLYLFQGTNMPPVVWKYLSFVYILDSFIHHCQGLIPTTFFSHNYPILLQKMAWIMRCYHHWIETISKKHFKNV